MTKKKAYLFPTLTVTEFTPEVVDAHRFIKSHRLNLKHVLEQYNK